MIEINEQNAEDIIGGNEYVVIDAWAEWCIPCKMLAPVFEKVSKKYSHMKFCKANIEENISFVDKYSIQSVPTILLFKNGQLVDRRAGNISMNELSNLLEDNQ